MIVAPLGLVAIALLLPGSLTDAGARANIHVTIWEGIPEKWDGAQPKGKASDEYDVPALGFVQIPAKVIKHGVEGDRVGPFALHAVTTLRAPQGKQTFLLRSKGEARVLIDGKTVVENKVITANSAGHEAVPEPAPPADVRWRETAAGDQEAQGLWVSDGQPHKIELWAVLGAKKLRPETGELSVSLLDSTGLPVLIGQGSVSLTDAGWSKFARDERARIDTLDTSQRRAIAKMDEPFWNARHALARREVAKLLPAELKAKEDGIDPIDTNIAEALKKVGKAPNGMVDDATFLRRLSLDTIGVPPTTAEVQAFLNDKRPNKRAAWIDARLADPRWADAWMGYWQDVLAENPGILKPTLNNTGPFRRYIYLALLDDMPFDRFVTELVRMDGSKYYGGPAGFGMATQNDAPMAAKAHVLAKAFLAADMKCARCHDAPMHPFDQAQLFGMAGLLEGKAQVIPTTSTVKSREGARTPSVTVSLHAGDKVKEAFDLGDLVPGKLPDGMIDDKASSRERLAAFLVSPLNLRFSKVMANRLWARYMGVGLAEPIDDWDGTDGMTISHPAVLNELARLFVDSGYSLKAVARRVLNTRAYQAGVENPPPSGASAEERRFAGPVRRRLTSEQLVDSLFSVAGKAFGGEELCVDPEGRRPANEMLNLGVPKRAWEFASTANERDRPALTLPITQTFVDLMQVYGWRPARQDPQTIRDDVTTPLQPALLANGVITGRIARLSDDSAFTDLAIEASSPEDVVKQIYLRTLSRAPSDSELKRLAEYLRPTFADRVVTGAPLNLKKRHVRRVSWSNHLHPRATEIQLAEDRDAKAGDPPTYRLRPGFRERVEDLIWALVNSPEFVFVP
jgi:hypothetical protein